MLRGRLYEDDYKPKLSGHETFPLRYGWLKKAFDAVSVAEDSGHDRSVFLADDAIARFGVGKNMVASIRHWAVVNRSDRGVNGTDRSGPVGESGCSKPRRPRPLHGKTRRPHGSFIGSSAAMNARPLGFWAFNHYPAASFERGMLVRGLEKIAKDRGWRHASAATIKNDVACFVRTYVSQPPAGQASHEDTLESPLTEIGLIRPVGRRDGYRFVRGHKPTLGAGVFCYAVTHFWSEFSAAQTLSFESLAYEPGSPGRVFLLDENALAGRLFEIEKVSGGRYRWSETAGLKQLIRKRKVSNEEALGFLEADYRS